MQGPSNILIAVVGHKADLVESRQVEESAGRDFAKEINGLFAETSAKDHEGGISELFTRIGENLPVLPVVDGGNASQLNTVDVGEKQAVSGAGKKGCSC